jgi:hypothetical protein
VSAHVLEIVDDIARKRKHLPWTAGTPDNGTTMSQTRLDELSGNDQDSTRRTAVIVQLVAVRTAPSRQPDFVDIVVLEAAVPPLIGLTRSSTVADPRSPLMGDLDELRLRESSAGRSRGGLRGIEQIGHRSKNTR